MLKKDGILRVCADYSVTVNKYIISENYPLPRIDDLFQALQGGIHFSKIDLKQAYHQLEVSDETGKLLTWSTHKDVYKVNRLPFGCKPNSSIFQSVIDRTLVGCEGTTTLIDDIIVKGQSNEAHVKNLVDSITKIG